MTNKLSRCAIYIRVSTAEQKMHGYSLQAQQEYLVKWAESHNMVVVGIYADEGKTARKEFRKRKSIHKLLEDVREGEIDVILFWKMDRWFRNVSDFYKVQDVLDEYNVKWISATEPNITMDTREGRLNLNMILAIGQNEVDTTSERIKFTVDNMIQNGRLPFGRANMPLGYRPGVVDGKKVMVKDEKEAPIVEDFFDYFLTYKSKKKTVLYIQNKYGIDFSYSRLKTMLASEFYMGKYRGVNYCPAYLTEEQWVQVQNASKKNVRTTRSGRIYLFSGLMRCPLCGQMLSGTGCQSIINRKTGEKRTYCYYRCNKSALDNLCPNKHKVSQNLIEEYLLNNLETEFLKYQVSFEKIQDAHNKERKKKSPDKLRSEMERLNLLFQKERITFEYYDSEYQRLEKELNELEVVIPIKKRNLQYVEDLLKQDFNSMYSSLTLENRQAFWHNIISEIILDTGYKVDHVEFL